MGKLLEMTDNHQLSLQRECKEHVRRIMNILLPKIHHQKLESMKLDIEKFILV
jgi:hypothetical protein